MIGFIGLSQRANLTTDGTDWRDYECKLTCFYPCKSA